MENIKFKIEKENWDSLNFNLKTGNIVFTNFDPQKHSVSTNIIKQILSIGQKEQYKLLYLKLPHNQQIPKLTNSNVNILLVDTKVIYKKTITNIDSRLVNRHVQIYPYSQTNEALLNLAFESGKFSRFRLDPNFPHGTFDKMYSTWIDKSVKKEIADNILVYQIQNEILGMLTYSVHSYKAIIGLFAVEESHQGQSIGSALLSSLEILMDEQVKTIEVATQKQNLNACSFYEKNLFFIKEKTNIYHIWL